MTLLGRARVSTDDQATAPQIDALLGAGCSKVYEDWISGTVQSQTGLDRAIADVESGDTLVVWKLDRLGRSLRRDVPWLFGFLAVVHDASSGRILRRARQAPAWTPGASVRVSTTRACLFRAADATRVSAAHFGYHRTAHGSNAVRLASRIYAERRGPLSLMLTNRVSRTIDEWPAG